MKRVTGLGGFFFKSTDPDASKEWYKKHLGLNTDEYGCTFHWKNEKGKDCTTQWSPFKANTDYFEPSKKQFMMNFRVENLVELKNLLEQEEVEIAGDIQEYSYGKFLWIMDNDGNKIELWEPIDSEL